MKLLFLALALLLTACIDANVIDVTTSTVDQAICNPDINTCPGGHPNHCTPIGQCTDAKLQNGTCCEHYGHPAYPTTVGEVICGNNLEGLPTCISHNKYFEGTFVQIECTTVTEWFGDGNGGTTQVTSTECHYS